MTNMLERRNVAVEAYGDGVLNDEKFVLLYDIHKSQYFILAISKFWFGEYARWWMHIRILIVKEWYKRSFWCSRNTRENYFLLWIKK